MKNKFYMKLVGTDGNAFMLLGRFSAGAKKAGWEKPEIDEVITKATSGDYNNLLRTIMENTTQKK